MAGGFLGLTATTWLRVVVAASPQYVEDLCAARVQRDVEGS